jgi:hypothetical protein
MIPYLTYQYRCQSQCHCCLYHSHVTRTVSRGSSVSIVSGYRRDDCAKEVRSPAEAKVFFFSLCINTETGAHPASCTMGTGVLSPGLKRGRSVTLTTHPHLVLRSRMIRSYTYSTPTRLLAFSVTALAFSYMYKYIPCG